jgi:hypothetical protein
MKIGSETCSNKALYLFSLERRASSVRLRCVISHHGDSRRLPVILGRRRINLHCQAASVFRDVGIGGK